MAFYTYILYSASKDRYYIGSTSDVNERLSRHNAGATTSTKPGRPWIVVYSEEYPTKDEAVRRENYLKKMKSRRYLETLIRNNRGSSAG